MEIHKPAKRNNWLYIILSQLRLAMTAKNMHRSGIKNCKSHQLAEFRIMLMWPYFSLCYSSDSSDLAADTSFQSFSKQSCPVAMQAIDFTQEELVELVVLRLMSIIYIYIMCVCIYIFFLVNLLDSQFDLQPLPHCQWKANE
jgi:hypothetical protein